MQPWCRTTYQQQTLSVLSAYGAAICFQYSLSSANGRSWCICLVVLYQYCIEGQYFPLRGFLFGRHCGQMTGQMVKETVGPYACLTHALRIPYANHSPCIGKIEAVLKQKMHLMHCFLASNVAMTGWNYTLQNNISKHIITWRFNIETRNLTQQEYWTHPYASLRNSGFCLRAWMIWPPQD